MTHSSEEPDAGRDVRPLDRLDPPMPNPETLIDGTATPDGSDTRAAQTLQPEDPPQDSDPVSAAVLPEVTPPYHFQNDTPSKGAAERRGYGKTVLIALGGSAVAAGAAVALSRLGIRTGNAGVAKILEALTREPLKTTLQVAVGAPLLEEFAFRALPSELLDKALPNQTGRPAWGLGVAASAVFAAAHGLKNQEGRIYPIPQFMTGMLLWGLYRRRGPDHAVVAHGVVNGAIAISALAGLAGMRYSHRRSGSDEPFEPKKFFVRPIPEEASSTGTSLSSQ